MTPYDPPANGDWVAAALETYEGPLTRYAQRIVGDIERARDVVQETFLKLCREDREQIDGHLAKWLYTVCRNQALDVRKKEQRMTTSGTIEIEGHGSSPVTEIETRDSAAQVFIQLDRLPDNQKEVLRLKFQGGLRYREIAEVTGLSVGNVGFLIHRGLKSLRERLAVGTPIPATATSPTHQSSPHRAHHV